MSGRSHTVRSNAEIISQLPKFETSPSLDYPQWLKIVCPREDCISDGMYFMVKRAIWRRKRLTRDGKTVITGRPCAYCGRYGSL